MKKTLIIIGILIIVGLGIYYVFTNQNIKSSLGEVGQNNSENINPPTVLTANKSDVIVNIKDYLYLPSVLTIKPGTKVTWINNDSVAHTVTSETGNILNSAPLQTGQSFNYTFNESGKYNYYCTLHPEMKATVVVVIEK